MILGRFQALPRGDGALDVQTAALDVDVGLEQACRLAHRSPASKPAWMNTDQRGYSAFAAAMTVAPSALLKWSSLWALRRFRLPMKYLRSAAGFTVETFSSTIWR